MPIQELCSGLILPSEPVRLLKNVKWIIDHDLLLREDFYAEQNLKLLSCAERIETHTRDLSVQDRPRYSICHRLVGVANLAERAQLNSGTWKVNASIARNYHNDRLEKTTLRINLEKPASQRVTFETIKEIIGTDFRSERPDFYDGGPRPEIHPLGNKLLIYESKVGPLTRHASLFLDYSASLEGIFIQASLDTKEYVPPYPNQEPFSRWMTIIPVPLTSIERFFTPWGPRYFNVYAHDQIAAEFREYCRVNFAKVRLVEFQRLSRQSAASLEGQRNRFLVERLFCNFDSFLIAFAEAWRRRKGYLSFKRAIKARERRNHEQQKGILGITPANCIAINWIDDEVSIVLRNHTVLNRIVRDVRRDESGKECQIDLSYPNGKPAETLPWRDVHQITRRSSHSSTTFIQHPSS